MITQQQAEEWIREVGLSEARRLCLAIECYTVAQCSARDLLEFLCGVYQEGHKGTNNYDEQQCIDCILGTENFFDAGMDESDRTMDELVRIVGDDDAE